MKGKEMRNIRSIDDLTEDEQLQLFWAQKKEPTAFVPMTEPCVVLTAEGDGYRLDNWQEYFIAVGKGGDVWPMSKKFFEQNYEELGLQDQFFHRANFMHTLEKK